MQLHQFRTDGQIDVTELHLRDVAEAKFTALSLVAYPAQSGVFRIQFVDAEYDRVCWDSYAAFEAPRVGALAFAGVA
jgi:hypothetical protein